MRKNSAIILFSRTSGLGCPDLKIIAGITIYEKSALVFVNRVWHSQNSFDTIRAHLAQGNYPSIACRLPPFDILSPVDFMEPGIASVRDAVEALLSGGKIVICVAHSYSETGLIEVMGTHAQRS